jgi:hypothetical protein
LLSLVGTVVTIVLGWPPLYKDILSKTIKLPIWLVVCLGIGLLFVIFWRKDKEIQKSENMPLKLIQGKRFGVQQVVLDGKHFDQCTFVGTELIFEGIASFGLSHCVLENPRISFNRYAATTISALPELYSDPAFHDVVEKLLQDIRTQTLHPAPFTNPNNY